MNGHAAQAFLDGVLQFLDRGLLDAAGWQVVAYTLVVTHVTIIAVTVYLHRCQAHRALELHPLAAHAFRFWLWLTTGMVTREWAAVHRKHHAKCESADDPHSPLQRGLREVLLRGTELYRAEASNAETVRKYGQGAPDDWIERRLYAPHRNLGVLITLVVDVALFGVIGLTVFGVQMLWIPVFAAGIVNGVGHARGYRNFECPDASTNIVPWGILIGGEELHNNHHTFASSARLSVKWYEIDIGWMYIRLLSWLGLAKVRRVAPRPKFTAAPGSVDPETLHAVIAHRYDLMAQYARSLKRACAEEARRLRAMNRPEERVVASARRWLHVDAARWSEQQRARVDEVLAASERLRKLVEMRRDLAAVWERSNLSREQLVAHLQQWCQHAEASGIRALRDLSLRLRSYAPVAGVA